MKRSVATSGRRCPECGAEPDDEHASWCLAPEDEYAEIVGTAATETHDTDPLDD